MNGNVGKGDYKGDFLKHLPEYAVAGHIAYDLTLVEPSKNKAGDL